MASADQPTVEEIREEATAFLEANAERKVDEDKPFVWGEGDDDTSLFEEVDREVELQQLAEAQKFRAKRYDAGLAWITGPKQYGGRELSQAHDRAYTSVESKYEVPSGAFFGIGLGHGRADDPRPRPGPREGALPARAVPGRHRRLPAVQRAGRRLRPRRAHDAGRARRRRVGRSTARRCGPRAPSTPTSARSSAAPIPTSPSTRASPGSSSTCTHRASRSARCAR